MPRRRQQARADARCPDSHADKAITSHRRAATSKGREPARTRVSNANSAVAEHLDGHASSTKRLNLCNAQLARSRHALNAQLLGSQPHGTLAMSARLSGQVNLDPRNRRTKRTGQPGIGHNQRIGTQRARMRPQRPPWAWATAQPRANSSSLKPCALTRALNPSSPA